MLLSQYDTKQIEDACAANALVEPLATLIQTDEVLRSYLSYGTNSKANMRAAFEAMNQLIKNNLNL